MVVSILILLLLMCFVVVFFIGVGIGVGYVSLYFLTRGVGGPDAVCSPFVRRRGGYIFGQEDRLAHTGSY